MGACDRCPGDDDLSYTCNECGGTFCSTHRLPEAHNCPTLLGITDRDDAWFKDELSVRENRQSKRIIRRDNSDADEEANPESGETPADTQTQCVHCGRITNKTCDDCGTPYCKRHKSPRIHNCALLTTDTESAANVETPGLPPGPSESQSSGRGYTRYAFLIAVLVTLAFGAALVYGAPVDILDAGGEGGPTAAVNDSSPTTAQTTTAPASTSTAGARDLDAEDIEELVHEQINEERTDAGLAPLDHDPELRAIASSYAKKMATEGFYAHESPAGKTFVDRYEAAGYDCRVDVSGNRYATGAENIQYTYAFVPVETAYGSEIHNTERELADAIVRNWMTSIGHQKNILKSYWENEGIGIYIIDNPDGPGKRVYAVQNFC